MASSPQSPSLRVPVAAFTPKGNPVAATAVVLPPSTLATELAPQAVAGTSSAHVIIASHTQAVFLPVWHHYSPTWAVASVLMRSRHNYSSNDERSLPAKRFYSGEELRAHT